MGAYHRMDIGIQFHKKKRWGERTWEISFYNAYNRKNPFFYFIGVIMMKLPRQKSGL
jgi:hypothetical protein